MKIESFRHKLGPDKQMEIVTPWDPVGAKNIFCNFYSLFHKHIGAISALQSVSLGLYWTPFFM